MKRYSTRGQRVEDLSNVDFGAAGDTNMKMWKAKIDEFLNKPENPFAGRWNSRGIRALIDGVHDKVYRKLTGKCDHFLQAFYQDTIAGLLLAIFIDGVKPRQNIATRTGSARELREKGRDQIMQVLFSGVPEVKIEITHSSLPGIAHDLNIFDDCGAET
jgi:hypothetical protein